MNDRRDRHPDTDDFWDIDDLIPRPSPRPLPPPRPTPTAVDLELPPCPPPTPLSAPSPLPSASPVQDSALTLTHKVPSPPHPTAPPRPEPLPPMDTLPAVAHPTTHYVPPHTADIEGKDPPLLDYRPAGTLIHRVRVYDWQSNYHYFDQFTEDAIRYAAMPASATAAHEPFFSYFPQYTQLNRRASAWYLYWREAVRHGTYPSTDYSYILLYLFELLNLPADSPDEARRLRDLMAAVWVNYRRTYPQLDHYMCEWLCDYCLVHAELAPLDILAPALDEIIEGSRLKEFYLGSIISGDPISPDGRDHRRETVRILLRHCCQYDYRKSKFAAGEHRPLFDRLIPAALAHALPLLLGREGHPPAITMLESTVTRDAYTGALCAYRNKRRIEVSFTSFSRSHELRFLIGDMVKHVENRIRAAIGVRSRLSVMSLPVPLRNALDDYLSTCPDLECITPQKKKEAPRPAYEALYDLPRKEVSLSDAVAIEAGSWETTRILVEAFSEEEPASETVTAPAEAAVAKTTPTAEPPAPATQDPADELRDYVPFLRAALRGDAAAARAAANARHTLPDALADAINAITSEAIIYDIIIEDDGTGRYTVLDDYRDEVEALVARLDPPSQ